MIKFFRSLYKINEYFAKLTLKSITRIQKVGYIAMLISYIQIFILILEQNIFISKTNSDFLAKIHKFLVYFTNPISLLFLQQHVESCNTFILYIYPILFLGFVLVILYFLAKFFTQRKEEENNQLWGFICYVYEKCLYIIVFRFTLSLITSTIYFSHECAQIILLVNLIISLINIGFAGWLCFFALPIMQFQFKHSMKSRKINFINIAFKTLTTLIIDTYYILGNNWIFLEIILLQVLYLILSFYFVCCKLVFYSRQMQKIIGSLVAVMFTLTLISTINYIFQGKHNELQILIFYIWIIFIPFIIKLTLTLLEIRINKILITPINNIENEDDIIIKLIDIYESFSRAKTKLEQETENFMKMISRNEHGDYLDSYLNNDILDDVEESNGYNKNYLISGLKPVNHRKKLYILMHKVYRYGIQKFPNSILIRMIFVNYLNMNKHIKSIENLSTIIISQIYSIINENNLVIKANLKILQLDNMQCKSSTIDIIHYVVLTNIINTKLEILNTAFIKYLDFWKRFNSQDSGNSYLLLYSKQANQQYGLIMKIFKNIENKKGDDQTLLMFIKPLLFISIFILAVRFNKVLSNKCMELHYYIQRKFEKICQIEALNDETLFENNNVFITVSGNKKTLGNILTCNSSIQKHLGYDSQALISKNINILLPKSLQPIHHQYLTNFLETGNSHILDKVRVKPVMNQKQTITFINLYVQVNPLLDNGLSFVGFLRPIHSERLGILLRYDGQIDGMSEKLAKLIFQGDEDNIPISFLKITEGYSHIHHAFNFIGLTNIIFTKVCRNREKLINMCREYQNHANDDLEIFMVFQAVHNIISSDCSLDELISKIINMKEYQQIKRIYDLYSTEEITFKLKIKNDDHMVYYSIKCNLQDESFQDHQLLRILNIIDIQLDPDIKNLKSIKMPSLVEERINIDMEDRKISEDFYGYNYLYPKKTKTEIENYRLYADTKNYNLQNQTEAILMEYEISLKSIKKITNHIDTIRDFSIQNYETINMLSRLNHNSKVNINYNTNTQQLTINTHNSHFKDLNVNKDNSKTSAYKSHAQVTKNYLEKKMNEALNYIYISNLNKFMITILITFLVISIILAVITYNTEITIESNYLQNTSALYSWNMAYENLMDISYKVKEIYCVQTGYIPNDLWISTYPPDLLEFDIPYAGKGAILLKNYFQNFANEIYSLTEDLKDKILQTSIHINDVDPITFNVSPDYMTRDIISATYELINKLMHVGAISMEEKWKITSEIIYIVNNIYGDICIAQQKINDIIFEAIANSYVKLQNEKLIKYIVVISFGIFCLLVLKYQMRQYYKRYHEFLKNLIKLQSQKTIRIEKNIESVLDFLKYDPMEESLIEFKEKVEKQNKISQIITDNNNIYKINNQSGKINSTLIKRRNYIKGILGLCFISTFILAFLLDYILSNNSQKQNEMNILRFIEALGRYTNNSIAVGVFYIYLANNGTGIFRNNDISVELDALYRAKSNTSYFRSIFMNENQNYDYSEYLVGNVCELVKPEMTTYCIFAASQRAQYGIFALEEWTGNNLILLKQSFDSSIRSQNIIKEYFASKTFTEIVSMDFTIEVFPYDALVAAIKHDIDDKIIQDRQEKLRFMTIGLISFVLSILIFGYPLSRKICLEFMELKILLLMFPIRMVLKNTYFKTFIFQTSKPILQNMRNLL